MFDEELCRPGAKFTAFISRDGKERTLDEWVKALYGERSTRGGDISVGRLFTTCLVGSECLAFQGRHGHASDGVMASGY
jgi:hypothetical protein